MKTKSKLRVRLSLIPPRPAWRGGGGGNAPEAKAAGLLRPGMKMVGAAFGAGLSWGTALVEVV